MIMSYKVSENKKAEWKEQAKENQNQARELILSVSKSYTENPEKMAEILEFASRFYQYSLHNMQLIYAQNDHAAFVQSFDAWKKMDAHVKKGERGMKIWVPVKLTILILSDGQTVPLSEASEEQKKGYYNGYIEGKKVLRFKIGTVFDIAQTDFPKERYPELYSMGYSSAEHAQIVEGLIKFCESLGCNVFTRDLSTITGRGYYQPSSNQIVLNSLLEDTQRLSTLSHEIGHMLEQHGKREISSAQKEFEADCISVLIQSHYGIELTDSRKGHLAEHYKLFEREMAGSDTPLSQEDKIKHVEDVLDASMKVFRQYADQMDEYVKNAIENRPIAVDFDNKPILSFSFEVNECAEFPSMGNTYSNIMSAQEALKIFENISDYKRSFIGGINLIGKTSSGEQLETVPIVNGRSIDFDMLHYYPVVKENLQAEKMVKELVDEARKENYSTYGKYDFSNSASENILSGNRRRRGI